MGGCPVCFSPLVQSPWSMLQRVPHFILPLSCWFAVPKFDFPLTWGVFFLNLFGNCLVAATGKLPKQFLV